MAMTSDARTGAFLALLAEHLVGAVVVAEVRRRQRAEGPQQLDRDAGLSRPASSASTAQELRKPVHAIDADGTDPGEVVQPDMLQLDPAGLDTEPLGQPPLEVDRDVAQPDRAVAGVEKGLRDDADRVCEVDQPRARAPRSGRSPRRCRARPARSEAPSRTRPAPVVSWPMVPNRGGSVSSTSRAAWPPIAQLDEDEVRALQRLPARSVVVASRPGQPECWAIRRASPPTIASRSASMS